MSSLKYRILIIEDDEGHQELISRAFEDTAEMEIVWATRLEEARRALAEGAPDLIISDWRLPDGDGIELLTGSGHPYGMIIMTSYGNEELAVKSIKAGILDYIVKSPESFQRLPGTALRALREWENVRGRREAEDALTRSERRYRRATEGATDVIWEWRLEAGTVYISGRWFQITGQSSEGREISENDMLRVVMAEDVYIIREAVKRHVAGETESFKAEFRVLSEGHTVRWLAGRGTAFRDDELGLTMTGAFTDVTERKEAERRIFNLAYFDEVTGLPNRAMLVDYVADVLDHRRRQRAEGVMLYLDLDHFKAVNDLFGHSYGDRVLAQIGSMLKHYAEEQNMRLFRLGGDEFVFIRDGFHDRHEIEGLSSGLLSLFADPVNLKGNQFPMTVSAGVVRFPDDGNSLDELLMNADSALYAAKGRGRNTWAFFDQSLASRLRRRLELESRLRQALLGQEFLLYYQPQMNLKTGALYGFEALLRWKSPLEGMIPPSEFIHIAEESGQIVGIGRWVFREACRFAARLIRKGTPYRVSANFSAVQLMQGDFVNTVQEIARESGVLPAMIGIEITETALIEGFDSNVDKLLQLRTHGFAVLLDDFGTGYSSLSYLNRLPVDVLKIDKSFVDDIRMDGENAMMEAVIGLGHRFHMTVLAEGVETEDQRQWLADNDCDVMQGYLFGKPLPEQDALKFLPD